MILHETPEILADRFVMAPGPDAVDGAICAQSNPDSWFPEKGQDNVAKTARRLCQGCPVKAWCLMAAIERREVWGVWGGLSERQRAAIIHTHPALAQDPTDGAVAA